MCQATFLLCFFTLAVVLPTNYAVEYEEAGSVHCRIQRQFISDPPSPEQDRWHDVTTADECKAVCTDQPKCHGVSLDSHGCSMYFDACFKSLQVPNTDNSEFMRNEVYLKKGMNDQTAEQYRALQDAKKECLKNSSFLKRVFKFVDKNNDDHICDDEVVDLLKTGALKYFGDKRLAQNALAGKYGLKQGGCSLKYFGDKGLAQNALAGKYGLKQGALKHLPQPCSTFNLLVDTFVDQEILLANPYLTPSDLSQALCEE